jgi:uncharacterized protein YidB (DUF937 family)
MSGLLGQILGSVLGGNNSSPQGGQNVLGGILQQVLTSNGGISGLVSQFESAGLGQIVQSWVGTGSNAPISTSQIGQVFSSEQLTQWASQAGTTPDALREVLAQALPATVDHATPGGTVPDAAGTPDLSAILSKVLGSRAS